MAKKEFKSRKRQSRSKHYVTGDKLDQLGERVWGKVMATHHWAGRKGLPPWAVIASALETSVNMLAFLQGRDQVAELLEELAEMLREGEGVRARVGSGRLNWRACEGKLGSRAHVHPGWVRMRTLKYLRRREDNGPDDNEPGGRYCLARGWKLGPEVQSR